jgi:hypothetical protein
MSKTFKSLVWVFVLLAFSETAFAFTSFSQVPGDISTLFRANNFDTQAKADKAALTGCRTAARKNGHAKTAKKCVVVDRSRGPGYGALVCGDGGCAWRTGYDSAQAAADDAYGVCHANYTNCQQTNIDSWLDTAGFPHEVAAQPQIQQQPSMSDIYRARWCAKQNLPPSQCGQ